jgi:hypothetical protein
MEIPTLMIVLHHFVMRFTIMCWIRMMSWRSWSIWSSKNPELLSSRDQDGSLPLHVACRLGVSFRIAQALVNSYKASVKSVTSEGDLPLFLACEMPKTSLDTIFLLMKLCPDLVCCLPAFSIAKTIEKDLFSDSDAFFLVTWTNSLVPGTANALEYNR